MASGSKASLPDAFQVFAKPAGAICNLDCSYCYYLEKTALYPGTHSFRMSESLLETYVKQHIEATAGDEIRFSWHGGEPTSIGLDFYRTVVALQKAYTPAGKRVFNGMVTNGTLLDDDWYTFLRDNHFSVGLSLDGPEELHDVYRVSKGNKPTHALVVRAFEELKRVGVPCDILCVLHDKNVEHPRKVYSFFKELGATYVGFLPVVDRRDDLQSGVSDHTVPPEAYGRFLCTIFDEWVCNDIGRILVQIFDEAARPLRKLEHALCIYRETCGDVPVLEHNGDLFSCDHYVDQDHLLGNIEHVSLGDLVASERQIEFGLLKRNSLPRFCQTCPVLSMCNGGCPKDRFIKTPDGEDGLNYLCAGLKMFFTHCRPVFRKLIPLWKAGAHPGRLMAAARSVYRPVVSQPGRNDPCPCGSGRKYKQCCMGKA